MKSYVHVEYLDGKTEDIGCPTTISAFEKQRKLLSNEKFMKNIKVLEIRHI